MQVYELLRKLVGDDVNEENWTSSLRGENPGFKAYEGAARADFFAKDKRGLLTGLWLGDNFKTKWQDEWPVYYIEVKASSKDLDSSFHFSRTQFATVSLSVLVLLEWTC